MSLLSVIAALVPSIANVVSTMFTNKSNQQLMEGQQEYNTQMLDKQNEYNTPANQVQRLKDAGINPTSLGMGSGISQSGGQSASALPVDMIPMLDPLANFSNDYMSMMSGKESYEKAITDMSLRDYRVKQAELENEKLTKESQLLGLDAQNQIIVNQFESARQQLALKNGYADLDLKKSEKAHLNKLIESLQVSMEKEVAETLKIESDTKVNYARIDEIVALIASHKADTRLKDAQTALTDAETQTETYQAQKVHNESLTAGSEAENAPDLYNKIIEKYGAEIKNISAQTNKTETEVFWYILTNVYKGSALATKVGAFAGAKIGAFMGK